MSTTQNMLLAQAATEAAPAVAAPAAPAAVAPATQVAAPAQTTATTVVPSEGKGGFSAKPTVGEIVEFQLTGLLVVFVVLGAITAISSLLSALLKALVPDQYYCKKPAMETTKAAPAKAAAPAATASGLTHDKLLVILAAAQEVLGKSAMVVSYTSSDAAWAMQGRVAHHHSHSPKA